MRNSNDGFTLAELVVSISIMGIVMSFAIPTFDNVTMDTQRQINRANMSIIKDTFLRFYQETHMKGNPQLPTEPDNNLLDIEFGYVTKLFIITDVDEDSPSYEEFIIGEI